MDNLNFLMGALSWSLTLWPVLVTIGSFGLFIILVGAWIFYDAITWRRKVKGIRRRLEEKDLSLYYKDGRVQ